MKFNNNIYIRDFVIKNMRIRYILLVLIISINLCYFVNAAAVQDILHLSIQVENESHSGLLAGTYNFTFNITSDSGCNTVVYSNKTQLTTNGLAKVSYFLENVTLDFQDQYWLCVYRDGVLTNVSRVARAPYSFMAKNVTWSGVIGKPSNLSQFTNDLVFDHNVDLTGLQGGSAGEYYHLTSVEAQAVVDNWDLWVTTSTSSLINYYLKTDVYNKTEVYNSTSIDNLLTSYLTSTSIISSDYVNKTSGTFFEGWDLTSIIDDIKTLVDDHTTDIGTLDTNKLDITDQRYNDTNLINNVNSSVYSDLYNHTTNYSNPHNVTAIQVGAVDLTSDQDINGTKNFLNIPLLPDLNPTLDNEAVRKAYVDALVFGLIWQEEISGRNTTEPVSPTSGERWRVLTGATGNWTGYDDRLAEYNGTTWEFDGEPQDAWAVLDTSDNTQWRYNAYGSGWIKIGASSIYSTGNGLQLTINTFSIRLRTGNSGMNFSDLGLGIDFDSNVLQIVGNKLGILPGGINNTHLSGNISNDKLNQLTQSNLVNYSAINMSGSVICDIDDVDCITTPPGDWMVATWYNGSVVWVIPNSSVSNQSLGFFELTLHSHPASSVTWTIPTTVSEFYNNVKYARRQVDLSSALNYRIFVNQLINGNGNTRVWVQYSLNNGTTWVDMNNSATSGVLNISKISTANYILYNGWTPVPLGAKRDVTVRLVGTGGFNNATTAPTFRQVAIQFQVPLAGDYNITYNTISGGGGSGVSAMINLTDVKNQSGNFYTNKNIPIANGSTYVVRQLNSSDLGDINNVGKNDGMCLVFDNSTQKLIYSYVCGVNGSSTVNFSVTGFDFVSYPGAQWSSQPLAETEVYGSSGVYIRQKRDFTNAIQYRIHLSLSVYGAPNSTIYLQYNNSNTGYKWYNLSTTTEANQISVNATGTTSLRTSAWYDIPVGARADTNIRVVGRGGFGNATSSPYFRQLRVEYRILGLNTSVISGSSYNETYDSWSYNQTLAANTTIYNVYNDVWRSTYNETYAIWTYNQTLAGNNMFLNLSGTNANQDINIGSYAISASGNSKFGDSLRYATFSDLDLTAYGYGQFKTFKSVSDSALGNLSIFMNGLIVVGGTENATTNEGMPFLTLFDASYVNSVDFIYNATENFLTITSPIVVEGYINTSTGNDICTGDGKCLSQLNNTINYSLYVPYEGANQNVNLSGYNVTASNVKLVGNGTISREDVNTTMFISDSGNLIIQFA